MATAMLVSFVAQYPMASVFYRVSGPKKKQALAMLFGGAIAFANYGQDALISLQSILATWAILNAADVLQKNGLFAHARAVSVALNFTLHMGILLGGYAYNASAAQYDIDWTMAQCVLCLRMIGLAWDFYDGDPSQAEPRASSSLTDAPGLFECLGYGYFFCSFLAGPQFPLKKYRSLIDGSLKPTSEEHEKARMPSARKKFLQGAAFLIAYQGISTFFRLNEAYLRASTRALETLSFMGRLVYVTLTVQVILIKYLGVWLIVEGSCIVSGLGYSGDSNPAEPWSAMVNVKPSIWLGSPTLSGVIPAFNINTNEWVKTYVMKRLKFLGNLNASKVLSLAFLAIWHGFAPGYLITFMLEFADVMAEDAIIKRFKGSAFASSQWASRLGMATRTLGVSLGGASFIVKTLEDSWYVHAQLWHINAIALAVIAIAINVPVRRNVERELKKE